LWQALDCPKNGLLNYILSFVMVARYAMCQPQQLRATLFSNLSARNKLAFPRASYRFNILGSHGA
jgi:hypothetical protein